MALNLVRASNTEQREDFSRLVEQYREELDESYCFQSYEKEQSDYKAPNIYLFIAYLDDKPCGCVGFWPLKNGTGYEMKRLFVPTDYRKQSIARQLLDFSFGYLQDEKVEAIELETLSRLDAAIALYKNLGFRVIENTRNCCSTKAIAMRLSF